MGSLQFAIEILRDSNGIFAPQSAPYSPPLAGSEFPQSIRRAFHCFPQSARSIFEPSLFVNTSAIFDADVLVAPHGSALLLTLLLWLGLNFRRVSAEHFIGFRRVPG